MRYTPAGVAVLGMQLQHESEQVEGGASRVVKLLVTAKAVATVANQLEQALQQRGLGQAIQFSGFLATRQARQGQVSKSVVLHITAFQYSEN
jgi:primosomal replication protein N